MLPVLEYWRFLVLRRVVPGLLRRRWPLPSCQPRRGGRRCGERGQEGYRHVPLRGRRADLERRRSPPLEPARRFLPGCSAEAPRVSRISAMDRIAHLISWANYVSEREREGRSVRC